MEENENFVLVLKNINTSSVGDELKYTKKPGRRIKYFISLILILNLLSSGIRPVFAQETVSEEHESPQDINEPTDGKDIDDSMGGTSQSSEQDAESLIVQENSDQPSENAPEEELEESAEVIPDLVLESELTQEPTPEPSTNPSPAPSLRPSPDASVLPEPVTEPILDPSPLAKDEPAIEPTPSPQDSDPSPEPAASPEISPSFSPSPSIVPSFSPVVSTPSPSPEPQINVEKLKEEIRQQLIQEMEKNKTSEEANLNLKDKVESNNFSEADCVKLSESELYCLKKNISAPSKPSPSFTGAYVSNDDGDSEIMFQKGERVVKISDNDREDVLPFYDEAENMIVWQSLIKERWQIMVCDLDTLAVRQITETDGNNLNPRISGGLIVWQGWKNNNWEIFMANPAGDSSEWQISTVTDNYWHDINPKVVNGYILWEAFKDDNWQIFSYSLETKNIEQLSRGAGRNSNPRLAVLWESEENGVVKTLQYDVTTQTISTVTTKKSASSPVVPEIPSPPSHEKEATLPVTASNSFNSGQRDNNDEE